MTEARCKNYGSWVRSPGYVRKRGEHFLVQLVSPPRKRRSSQIVVKDGHAAPGKCGGELDKEKNGHPFVCGRAKGTSTLQLHVGRQLLDDMSLSEGNLKQMLRDLTEDAGKWDLVPKTCESLVEQYLRSRRKV